MRIKINPDVFRASILELEKMYKEAQATARYTPEEIVPARISRRANKLISDILFMSFGASPEMIFEESDSDGYRFDVFVYALARWLRLCNGLVSNVQQIALELQSA